MRVYRPFKHLAPFQYGQTSVKYSQVKIPLVCAELLFRMHQLVLLLFFFFANSKPPQEIWLLGHHTLADIREKIWCPTDLNVVGAQQVSH